MTVELITGHAGSAHVSSADVGWFNAGTVGADKYVLNTGTQFAATVQNANLVTIGTGDAVFEGRHVRVSATENVTIDNGAQGVNRNDIICIKYTYTPTQESAELVVLKGTATSGSATDPTIPSGSILEDATEAYMPLWRIPISGITVGTPQKLSGDAIAGLNALRALINNINTPTWHLVETWSGATQRTYSLPSANEYLITCNASSFMASAVLQGQIVTSATKRLVLGGNAATYAELNISTTRAQGVSAYYNGASEISGATWAIYMR